MSLHVIYWESTLTTVRCYDKIDEGPGTAKTFVPQYLPYYTTDKSLFLREVRTPKWSCPSPLTGTSRVGPREVPETSCPLSQPSGVKDPSSPLKRVPGHRVYSFCRVYRKQIKYLSRTDPTFSGTVPIVTGHSVVRLRRLHSSSTNRRPVGPRVPGPGLCATIKVWTYRT